MRKLTRVMAGFASVAAAAALMAGSVTAASADPISNSGKAIVPAYYDIVGVGSNTTEYVMDQFSVNYNKTVKTHNVGPPVLLQLGRAAQGRERRQHQVQDHAQGRLLGDRAAGRLKRRGQGARH